MLAGRGLLTLTPVLAMGVVGAIMMRGRGRQAEAAVIGAVGISYFLYNAGYWLPFGGGSPGPRFLIPALPFLAIGLAPAYRRLPTLTLALAIPSVTFMLAGALTFPLIGENGTGTWANQLGSGALEHTVLTVLGVHNGWLAVAPLLAAVIAAIAFCSLATPRFRTEDMRPAVAALLAWAVVAVVGPSVAGDPIVPLDEDRAALTLVALALAASATALLAAPLPGASREPRNRAPGPARLPARRADLVDDQVASIPARDPEAGDRATRGGFPGRAVDAVGVQDHAVHSEP